MTYKYPTTLEEFKNSDIASMPGNTKARNASGYKCEVDTISLNDVISKYFDGTKIDYMSVDTEGSELLILKHFDFPRYAPKVVTVEHNFTDDEKELGQQPIIASVTLGAERIFHFKHKYEPIHKTKIILQNGSLLVMKGNTQQYYLHQLPKTNKDIGERINLTFRMIT